MNKRGLSGIVTALILIVLVLVAAGIVWAIVGSITGGSEEDINYNQQCLGILINAQLDECTGTTDDYSCSVILERQSGSSGGEIDGVELVFDDGSESTVPVYSEDNIGAKKLTTIDNIALDSEPTSVDIRVYIYEDDGTTKYFCS